VSSSSRLPTPLNWQKSSFSGSGEDNACLELAASPLANGIHIRESDDPTLRLTTTPARLGLFIRAIKSGDFAQL
jgi:hypothetical protein